MGRVGRRAAVTRLRRSDGAGRGFARVRRGRGFPASTSTGSRSAIRMCGCASRLSCCRPPGRTSGSVHGPTDTSRPPASMPRDDGSTAITTGGGRTATARSTHGYSRSRRACSTSASSGSAPSRTRRRTARDAAAKRMLARACAEVAFYLGNTPAVARAAYVDPRVVDLWRERVTVRAALDDLARKPPSESRRRRGQSRQRCWICSRVDGCGLRR